MTFISDRKKQMVANFGHLQAEFVAVIAAAEVAVEDVIAYEREQAG